MTIAAGKGRLLKVIESGQVEKVLVRFAGWLYGRDGVRDEYEFGSNGKTPCWLVDDHVLKSMASLYDLKGVPKPGAQDGGAVSDDDFDLANIEAMLDDAPAPEPKSESPEPKSKPIASVSLTEPLPVSARPLKDTKDEEEDEEENAEDFLESTGLKTEGERNQQNLTKPWMRFHKFVLVKTIEEVEDIVDRAIANGRCALDLETEGLDNRIDYDANKRPHTRTKIVGFCLSINGVGYYIPIRHERDPYDTTNPNVTPIIKVEQAIKRLCLAAQPELTEEGLAEDPLASPKLATPPKVVIGFWNAKFDQEYLYPITDIDFWHPESFEDGMLAAYTLLSEDNKKGLKEKAFELLSAMSNDGEVFRYEMIKYDELYGKAVPKYDRLIQKLPPMEGTPVVLYGCSDGICTELLCFPDVEVDWAEKPKEWSFKHVCEAAKTKKFSFTYRLEKQVVGAVRVMERNRTLIDKKEILRLVTEAETELGEIDKEIAAIANAKGFKEFNPGSTAQLAEFLFSSKGLDIEPKPAKTAEDQYKTDADTLETLYDSTGIEVLRTVVKRRQIEKVKGTYLEKMAHNTDEDNQLRFNFKQTGAATGRFTAPQGEAEQGFSGIPIQGIPASFDEKKPKVAHSQRRIFIPHPGYTMSKVDYAGEELRIVTNISKEPKWLKEFREGSGDLHTITAQAFWPGLTKQSSDFKEKRKGGKIANFSLIYGGGVQAIQRATKCDKTEAGRMKGNFDKSVPIFTKWVKRQHDSVKKHLGIRTPFKRWIAIPDADMTPERVNARIERHNKKHPDKPRALLDKKAAWMEAKKIRAACERKSTNYPIQGGGADVIKISLVKCLKEFHARGWLKQGDDSVRMLMTVHDEIVFEIKHERLAEAMPVIIEAMESPSKLVGWEIPLIVEPLIGMHWGDEFDWLKIAAGKEPVPDWLVGHLDIANMPKHEPKPTPQPVAAQAAPEAAPALDPPETQAEAPKAAEPKPEPQKKENGDTSTEVAIFTIATTYLTEDSIRLMRSACMDAWDKDSGKPLILTDDGGNTLIDSKMKILVDPERFRRALRDRNFGHGEYRVTKL